MKLSVLLLVLATVFVDGTRGANDKGVAVCEHKGAKYNLGDSFRDECNFCKCTKAGAVCTKKACPDEDDGVGICEHNGVVYYAGDTFKDDCNNCKCTKKGPVCTKRACHDI